MDIRLKRAARMPLRVEVVDDSFAVRLFPLSDRFVARVELADRLVAEVEQIGVEERKVIVRFFRPVHVDPGQSSVTLRVVFVLHPHRLVEDGSGEASNVSCREDILVSADAPALIDDDPVVDRPIEVSMLSEPVG